MKENVVSILSNLVKIDKNALDKLIEIPKDSTLGDYTFPCFILAKEFKKSPVEIAKSLALQIKSNKFEKIEAKGPYINFFINRKELAKEILNEIQKQKDKYGYSAIGKNQKIVIEMSSPNIAKPFGIGHLRSTIIGNSLSNIHSAIGFKVIKINYLGDWGTQFGKLILGYKKFGDKNKLKKDPIRHLLELYIKVNNDESFEDEAREWFKKLELGDKEALSLWKDFKKLSIKEFDEIYRLLSIKFDIISGESDYSNKSIESVMRELEKKHLIEESEGALIVNLEKYNLGVCLIKKKDGATLYSTRDIAAAIDRYNKYKFSKMIYEVGAEQKLHFKQIFKTLDLLGHSWAKNCVHVEHGLYLDENGKKLATRKGKTIFMEDIITEAKELAKKEILKREKVSSKELEKRAHLIALSAIFYGDLKNYRTNDITYNLERFSSFEGDTGPYLLYSYARARSILRKVNYKIRKYDIKKISDLEKNLIFQLANYPKILLHSYQNLSPNIIANYSFQIAQTFNEFYHSSPVIGSEDEQFKLALVDSFSQVLKNSLNLLGIKVLEKM